MSKMSKRAWIGILAVMFIGVTISIIIYAYYEPYAASEVMGRQQAAIMESYSVGEQARRYPSDAAYRAAQQAIYKLGVKGGYYSNPPCGEAANGYAIWGAGCYPAHDELLENFKAFFDLEFNNYLDIFKLPIYKEEDSILPTLGTEAEKEPKTLYDVVEYNKEIKVDNGKIIIEGFPLTEPVTYTEIIYKEDEETGGITDEIEDIIEVEYIVESAIMISSEIYNFEYVLDPYFKTELDVNLYKFFDDAEQNAEPVDSDSIYNYFEYDTDLPLLVGIGETVEEKNLIIRFAKKK